MHSTALRSMALLATLAVAPGVGAEPVPGIRPPAAPAVGPGSRATRFTAVATEVIANPVAEGRQVHIFRPTGDNLPAAAPVVLFAHGFGATDPAPYRLWLEHMARRGCVVVFPVYAAIEIAGGATRYDTLWGGFEAALRHLATSGAPRPDPARLGVVGHSFGGGAAPALAARAAARGYGSEGFYVECWAPWFDLDRDAWAALPARVHLLVGAFDGDIVCDPAMAAAFPARATGVPAARRAFRLLRSDDHGRPALRANHHTPLARNDGEVDALDTLGIWRLDDALHAFAITGDPTAGGAVFDTSAASLSLGAWSDGTPVVPLATGVPEAPPGRAHGPRAIWREVATVERGARRLFAAEAWSGLPLPHPDHARARALPRSERFLASPPAPPATPVGEATLFVAEGATVTGGDVERLRVAGVVLVTTSGAHPLADALRRGGRATALLVGRDGVPALWKPADDPNLVAAALDLLELR